eukprot:g5068.t1
MQRLSRSFSSRATVQLAEFRDFTTANGCSLGSWDSMGDTYTLTPDKAHSPASSLSPGFSGRILRTGDGDPRMPELLVLDKCSTNGGVGNGNVIGPREGLVFQLSQLDLGSISVSGTNTKRPGGSKRAAASAPLDDDDDDPIVEAQNKTHVAVGRHAAKHVQEAKSSQDKRAAEVRSAMDSLRKAFEEEERLDWLAPGSIACRSGEPANRRRSEGAEMGADLNSISGSWVLDLARSDTMEEYLRCLRAPEGVIEAQISGEQSRESRNVFAVQANGVVIHKRTALNNFTEVYYFDTDRVTQTGYGEWRSMLSLSQPGQANGLVITSTVPTADHDVHLVEVRELIDGGTAHTQVLHLTNLSTEEQHVTRRVWVRVPMTAQDHQNLFG